MKVGIHEVNEKWLLHFAVTNCFLDQKKKNVNVNVNLFLVGNPDKNRLWGEERGCHMGLFPPHYFHGFLFRDKI